MPSDVIHEVSHTEELGEQDRAGRTCLEAGDKWQRTRFTFAINMDKFLNLSAPQFPSNSARPVTCQGHAGYVCTDVSALRAWGAHTCMAAIIPLALLSLP